jgi:hypothetical protein
MILSFDRFFYGCKLLIMQWAQQDSNLRPADYELPIPAFLCPITECYKTLQASTDAGISQFPSLPFKPLNATRIVPYVTERGHKNGHRVAALKFCPSSLLSPGIQPSGWTPSRRELSAEEKSSAAVHAFALYLPKPTKKIKNKKKLEKGKGKHVGNYVLGDAMREIEKPVSQQEAARCAGRGIPTRTQAAEDGKKHFKPTEERKVNNDCTRRNEIR